MFATPHFWLFRLLACSAKSHIGVPRANSRVEVSILRLLASPVLLLLTLLPSNALSTLKKIQRLTPMAATAYSGDSQLTAAGTIPHEGTVAADPAVLPLGSRIRVTNAGAYSGMYMVTDTGKKVNGLHIDIYLSSVAAAREFGKKVVLVEVLETGSGKQDARSKDSPISAITPLNSGS
jgi:3D (Asp-Asp-Asp) domain-containing protein